MSLSPSVLDAMLAAGCTAEQIVAAVKAANDDDMVREQVQREAEEARQRVKREADAARKRRQRGAVLVSPSESRGQTRTAEDGADAPPPSLDKKAPHTPKELIPSAPASPARGEFDEFWTMFPNKVGKADAARAFPKARQRIDFESLMAGLRRYVGKTDDRPWCNPATWLNQDRWTDEPATVARGGPAPKEVGGMQSMFGQMREHLENGQGSRETSDQSFGAPVLSLPHRRTG